MKRQLTAALAVVAASTVVTLRRRAGIRSIDPTLRTRGLMVPLSITNTPTLRLVRRLYTGPVTPDDPVAVRVDAEGRKPTDVFLYSPGVGPDDTATRGALLWIHGGGTIMGTAAGDHAKCAEFADEAGIVVINVDYRLAPEHPFPAALEDCYTALLWLHQHAAALGVDPTRIAVGGASAGGGLAASLTQLAADRGEVDIAFQVLVYPMLDDRSIRRATDGTGRFLWTHRSNAFAWRSYLGRTPGGPDTPAYAAAARRSDLSGLPPAWIGVGDLDLFFAEDTAYAERLAAAGVPVDLHVVPRMYHGADGMAAQAPLMQAFRQQAITAVAAAVGQPR